MMCWFKERSNYISVLGPNKHKLHRSCNRKGMGRPSYNTHRKIGSISSEEPSELVRPSRIWSQPDSPHLHSLMQPNWSLPVLSIHFLGLRHLNEVTEMEIWCLHSTSLLSTSTKSILADSDSFFSMEMLLITQAGSETSLLVPPSVSYFNMWWHSPLWLEGK